MKSYSTLPQELYRSRPRYVRLSGAGRALASIAVVLCLAAPAVLVFLQRQAHIDRVERDALLQSGVVASGLVVRLTRDSNENKRATVYYRFAANGRTFEAHAKVPMARWKTLRRGSVLPIRLVPANPDVNFPEDVVPGVMPAALPYILAPLPLFIGLICFLSLQYQRGLLSDGRAALAVVKSVKTRRGQHGEKIRTLRYEFPLLNGTVHAGSVQTQRATLDIGSSIAVLYDDEHPRRSRPYPLSLVRLAESD